MLSEKKLFANKILHIVPSKIMIYYSYRVRMFSQHVFLFLLQVSNEHRFVHTLSRESTSRLYSPTVEWYWRCLVSPLLLRLAACLTAAMSFLVVWSEMTFFSITPTLSVFSGLVRLAILWIFAAKYRCTSLKLNLTNVPLLHNLNYSC